MAGWEQPYGNLGGVFLQTFLEGGKQSREDDEALAALKVFAKDFPDAFPSLQSTPQTPELARGVSPFVKEFLQGRGVVEREKALVPIRGEEARRTNEAKTDAELRKERELIPLRGQERRETDAEKLKAAGEEKDRQRQWIEEWMKRLMPGGDLQGVGGGKPTLNFSPTGPSIGFHPYTPADDANANVKRLLETARARGFSQEELDLLEYNLRAQAQQVPPGGQVMPKGSAMGLDKLLERLITQQGPPGSAPQGAPAGGVPAPVQGLTGTERPPEARDLGQWAHRGTYAPPPAGWTDSQIRASGEYVPIPTGDAQKAVRQANTVRQMLEQAEEIARRRPDLFFPRSGKAMSDGVSLGKAHLALMKGRYTGDPDIQAIDSIVTTLPNLVRLFGDTANIAVAERQIAQQGVGLKPNSREAFFAGMDILRDQANSSLTTMGLNSFPTPDRAQSPKPQPRTLNPAGPGKSPAPPPVAPSTPTSPARPAHPGSSLPPDLGMKTKALRDASEQLFPGVPLSDVQRDPMKKKRVEDIADLIYRSRGGQ